MKKYQWIFIIAIILASVILAGCTDTTGLQSQNTDNKTITVTDDTGAQVTIQEYPKRIVSLAPSETEILYAINTNSSGISLVGRNDYDDYPPQVESIPSIGGPQTLSVESIVSKNPDLVITTTVADKTIIEQLKNLGIPVLIFKLNTFEDVYRNIETLGEALGLEKSADDLVSKMKENVSEIENMPHEAPTPKVMYVVSAGPMYVAGNNTLQSEMIDYAGGDNIFSDKDGYFVASDEAIIDRSPDVIIVPYSGMASGYDIKAQLMNDSDLKSVPAVENGKIYEVDDDIASRPGPRITQGLELFYKCINGGMQ
ncbi:iron complex transport system substrate-binding protein [Methanomicrobium sp. W14]|uniref:ABC transporter substrate-binding protein n=1 Tax=Methanomicrobium sp. W14 TaxID=2817839 RepID=UPI001AE67B68|nr:ABC transporter substrate-binding protein [Methanomicrobium sp. W14]MBP2133183.1 iron complex transport system substrate-binding protein [Methanomicrobium sp. W14]